MMEKNNTRLTDEQRREIVTTFADGFEALLNKQYFSRMSRGTKVKSDLLPTKWEYGVYKHYTLSNGNKKLYFRILIRDWSWSDKTFWVEIAFVDGKNLSIPIRSIKRKSYARVWRHDYNIFYFIQRTSIIQEFIRLIELTPLDVGLFDTIQNMIEKMFK